MQHLHYHHQQQHAPRDHPAVTRCLAIIDIASGGWLSRSKRVLHALQISRSSSVCVRQFLVTNRRLPSRRPCLNHLTRLSTVTSPLQQLNFFSSIWRAFSNRVRSFLQFERLLRIA